VTQGEGGEKKRETSPSHRWNSGRGDPRRAKSKKAPNEQEKQHGPKNAASREEKEREWGGAEGSRVFHMKSGRPRLNGKT